MDTFARIYALTAQIPPGRVTTYGQLARLAGNPRLSRIVGCAMHAAPEGLPCHRVVNRLRGLCDAFSPTGRDSHRLLLEQEGVPFRSDGTVDLARCMWYGPDSDKDIKPESGRKFPSGLLFGIFFELIHGQDILQPAVQRIQNAS